MFNADFFPTPENVISQMLQGFDCSGKTILEPSAGSGNIVTYLQREGAQVIAVEKNDDLRKIVSAKCKVIGEDFLQVKSEEISHIQAIIMNPPFSADEKHILHAWNIAPAACTIIALCNLSTIENTYTASRKQLKELAEQYGSHTDLGKCFSDADRRTGVEVALIHLQKPADNYRAEFEGFFLDEEPQDAGQAGIMPYNVVRDLVNRYVEAVKIYDEQLQTAVKLNGMIGTFFNESIGFQCTKEKYQLQRNDFKKDLQKSAWMYIFDKMNMQKYATRGLREDINKFVEQQTQIPFTMKNIYRMIEIVIGTTEQRMDKALLEVFDKLTERYDENRYHVEGWKTNSHYLLNPKFIMPYVTRVDYNGKMAASYHGWEEPVNDMIKALCFLTGTNYDELTYPRLSDFLNRIDCEFGKWYSWGFFEIKGFKKGTMHFKFQNEDLCGKFNQRISKLKGYPLYEAKTPTSKKEKEEEEKRDGATAKRYKPVVLFETDIAA